MAVNRFEKPIESQFINTYVPLPFDAMLKAGAAKQQRYDQTAAELDASLSMLDQIQAIPDSIDEVRLKGIKNKVHQMAMDYSTKDLSDPFVKREINNIIRSAADPTDLSHIQQSFGGWQNYNKMTAAMKAKGMSIFGPSVPDFTNYDSREQGVFTGSPEATLDYEKAFDEFLSQVEPEFITEKTLPSGRVALVHGRKDSELDKHIDEGARSLINDPRIAQYLRGQNRTGDIDFLRETLKNRKPAYTNPIYTSAQFPPGYGKTGNVDVPTRPILKDVAAEVQRNRPADVERTLEELNQKSEFAQEELKRIQNDPNASDYQKNQAAAIAEKLQNEINYYENRKRDIREEIDAEFDPSFKKAYGRLLDALHDAGMKEEDLNQYLAQTYPNLGKMAAFAGETTAIDLIQHMRYAPKMINGIIVSIGDPVGLEKSSGKYLTKDTKILAAFQDVVDIENAREKAYKKKFTENMSIIETTKAVAAPQMSFSQGIAYIGPPGNKQEAEFQGVVLRDVNKTPEAWKVKGISDNLRKKKDINEWVKNSSLEYSGANFVPNEDGSVTAYVSVNATDKKGSVKETGLISLEITDRSQIAALARDSRRAGAPEFAARLEDPDLSRKVELHKWDTDVTPYFFEDVNSGKTLQLDVQWDQENNLYTITHEGMPIPDGVAYSTTELTYLLYRFQDLANMGRLGEIE